MIVENLGRRLAEAEHELHKARLGKRSTEVEVDGRRVKYNPITIEEIIGYRNQLRDESNGRRPIFGAIGVLFG